MGGGIRTFADAKGWLDAGVSRVIFGTVAITSPAVIKQTLDEFGPEKVIVGIDARQDKVAIDGWEKQTDTTVLDLALQMKELGYRENNLYGLYKEMVNQKDQTSRIH